VNEKPIEKLHTYQDLSVRFGVDCKTVARWFRPYKLFRPTRGTVRIPQSTLEQFLKDASL
jgi:hypothetical protein